MRDLIGPAARLRQGEGDPLIGGLIVTHGRLAYELLHAAETIEGEIEGVEAVPLEWNEAVEVSREKIREALERIGNGRGVIIFTDMFGGTPSNISLSFLEKHRVEIVTGVNLPMIIKFASLKNTCDDPVEAAHLIQEKGSKSIRVASELLVGDVVRENGSQGDHQGSRDQE